MSPRSTLARINDRFAERLADTISSMGLFWLCNLFILGCLCFEMPHDVPGWANFVSSNWFQLVALPVLAISNRVDVRRAARMHQQEMTLLREEMAILKRLCGGGMVQ